MSVGVSVIVPIYNTKEYLDRCVKSILNQTYKNLEIFLVDDGSTDGSSELCDEYARIEPRIQVIHKKNGGISEARNAALDVVTKDYVAFIDSDDYIDSKMIEILLENAINTDSDISGCGIVTVHEMEPIYCKNNIHKQIVLTSDQALEKFIQSTKDVYDGRIRWEDILVKSNSCDKLFKTTLLKKIRYPVGKICEDLLVLNDLIQRSQKIVIDTYKAYYYYQREGSIMHSKEFYKSIDDIEAYNSMKRYVKETLSNRKLSSLISLIICRTACEKYKNLYKEESYKSYEQLIYYMKENIWSVLFISKTRIAEKINYILFAYFPKTYKQRLKKREYL